MIRVGILGASGYGGSELIRRLGRHPDVKIAGLASRQFLGQTAAEGWPQLAGLPVGEIVFTDDQDVIAGADVVFMATPHGATAPLVARAHQADKVVIWTQSRTRSGTGSSIPTQSCWLTPATDSSSCTVPSCPAHASSPDRAATPPPPPWPWPRLRRPDTWAKT